MRADPLFVEIDVGTSGARAVVIDDGRRALRRPRIYGAVRHGSARSS